MEPVVDEATLAEVPETPARRRRPRGNLSLVVLVSQAVPIAVGGRRRVRSAQTSAVRAAYRHALVR